MRYLFIIVLFCYCQGKESRESDCLNFASDLVVCEYGEINGGFKFVAFKDSFIIETENFSQIDTLMIEDDLSESNVEYHFESFFDEGKVLIGFSNHQINFAGLGKYAYPKWLSIRKSWFSGYNMKFLDGRECKIDRFLSREFEFHGDDFYIKDIIIITDDNDNVFLVKGFDFYEIGSNLDPTVVYSVSFRFQLNELNWLDSSSYKYLDGFEVRKLNSYEFH